MKKVLAFGAVLAAAQFAWGQAGATITIQEDGNDVTATLSGVLDLDSLGAYQGTSGGYNGANPSTGALSMNLKNSDVYDMYNDEAWTPFGSGLFFNWDEESVLDAFHIFTTGDPQFNQLGVPRGYIDHNLEGTATKFDATLESLGLSVGSWTTHFSGIGGIPGFITIEVVPAPGALALLGVAGLGAMRRRR